MRLVASSAGVTGWLTRRECGGVRRLGRAPYAAAWVPPRLRVPIESIAADPRLLKVILLGFSRDGDHLLCSSTANGRYTLHVWRFRGRAPATPLASVALFAELREHAQPQGRELGGLFGAPRFSSAAQTMRRASDDPPRRRRRPRGAAAHHDV